MAISVEVIGGLDECCFTGEEVKIWSVFEKEWGIFTIKKAEQTENQLFFDPSEN